MTLYLITVLYGSILIWYKEPSVVCKAINNSSAQSHDLTQNP